MTLVTHDPYKEQMNNIYLFVKYRIGVSEFHIVLEIPNIYIYSIDIEHFVLLQIPSTEFKPSK
mgnify:CR=1 FL=1